MSDSELSDDLAVYGLYREAVGHEQGQDWRRHAALWEYVGDRLGDKIYGRTDQPAQLLRGYTSPRDAWADPRPDDVPSGYYRKEKARRRHRQAWAYSNAAEEAAAERRFTLAARLRRKEGFAWIHSRWGDRSPEEVGGGWDAAKLGAVQGQKWRWAARAFLRAALLAVESDFYDQKDERRTEYEPRDFYWRWVVPAKQKPEGFPDAAPDVDRIVECWRKFAEDNESTTLASALTKACERLAWLQSKLASVGRREEARELHFRRQKLMMEVRQLEGKHWRYTARRFHHCFSKNGTSPSRALKVLAGYLFLSPVLIWLAHREGWDLVGHGDRPAGFFDDVAFAIANALTLTVWDLGAIGLGGALVVAGHALLAYVLLGYTAWLLLRDYSA